MGTVPRAQSCQSRKSSHKTVHYNKHKRETMKHLLLTTIAAVLLVGFAESKLRAANSPNVVLFLVDDMGWMDSEPYGSKYYGNPYPSSRCVLPMRTLPRYVHRLARRY